ncbi:hypothetical protein JEU11_15490 [Paraglaciecola chathamensis]|uniref:Uncharacterized protein n=1 Tax=Paraglaciecola chathamensis TaxID=368405 RepID=A0ABS0WHE7_9ALTE|nr:hypothetical protein [Paraglaciecola chathamensis]MBJ2137863.1 hypothetical protein [Paraglaciecola chathamensis]
MSLYRAITQGSQISPCPPHSKAVLNSMFAVLLSISGPALAQEELEGPGIFSGEKGEFSLSEIFSDKESDSKAQAQEKNSAKDQTQANSQQKNSGTIVKPTANTHSNSSAIAQANPANQTNTQAPSELDEFALFKAWKSAKAENSPAYQEFLLWLEFQEYKHKKSD